MTEWNAETAAWYAEKYGDYPTNRLAVAELDLQPDETVLDVGCGTGTALRCAAERVPSGSLIGIDPVPRMVEIAQEKTRDHPAANRIRFKIGSAEDLPLPGHWVDFVLAFDSADHWIDLKRGKAEVHRVLKPGGSLAVVKDQDVPGAKKSIAELKTILEGPLFRILHQREIHTPEVRFLLFICAARKS